MNSPPISFTTLVQIATMLLLTETASFADPKPSIQAPDPIVGHWIWRGDNLVTVNADGTAIAKGGQRAAWTYVKGPEAERKYKFVWDGGIFVDSITALKDGKTLNAKDQKGA